MNMSQGFKILRLPGGKIQYALHQIVVYCNGIGKYVATKDLSAKKAPLRDVAVLTRMPVFFNKIYIDLSIVKIILDIPLKAR
jgi:hypothetical protein